jgi:hypothetical protein
MADSAASTVVLSKPEWAFSATFTGQASRAREGEQGFNRVEKSLSA